MNIQSLIIFLVAGVLLFSCTKEETVNHPEQVNGTATRITLTLKPERQQLNEKQGTAQTNRALPFPYETPTTAGSMIGNKMFSPQDESLITNVHILVFDPTGQIVSNNYIGELNFSETANIVSETYCGDNRDVWIVANADVNDTEETHLKDKLEKVENVNDLQTLLISTNENGLSRSDRLTMVGNTTVSIAPNMDPIPIQMHYLAGKVTVTVTDKTPADVEITITGWDVVNIPKRTYLKGRMNEDAVNGTVSADYLTTTEEYPFEVINTKSWAQSFFLFENRCGNRVDRPLPTNPSERYPGMIVSDTDQRGKAWYAPPGATYMLIYGTYSKSGQMNNVVYKIYLGENPVDNYDIKRGKHYQYNVNVNGLNDIHVDTNIDWGNSSFTVTPYGDLEKMDAHPDFRVLRIGATAAETNTPGYVTVEVLNNDNTPCNWLSVSPLNLYRYGIKQAGNPNQPFDDATGCFVRTKYTPAIADELSFDKATFGMTRKLTQIPFHQLAVFTFQDVVVYADEFNGTGERTAKVRVTYYKDENGTPSVVGQQEFDVAQQDAIKISNDLYMERYEESAMTLQPGMPSSLQGTITAPMQWGYSSEVLYGNTDRYTDGAFLTANAVYKSVTRGDNLNAPAWSPVTSYTSYRDLYPRTGEKVSNPSSLQTEPIYYYPMLSDATAFNQYFDPIYNSSAARYCHEKNKDVDGDGVISQNEAVWYLPSLADMIKIANTSEELITPDIYWTSTEENFSQSWVYTFPNTPETKEKTEIHRVRCIRGKGTIIPDATLESAENDKTKINLNYTAGANGAFTISDNTNLRWTITSSDNWLKIAEKANGMNAANEKIGKNDASFFVYANVNANNTERTTKITLTRAGLTTTKDITVIQKRTPPPAEITTDKSELNFFSGESKPFTIDDKGNGLPWTVTSSDKSWLLIATDAKGKDASEKKTGTGGITLYAYTKTKNLNGVKRTATLTLSQTGMVNKTIDITQTHTQAYYPLTNKAWAGCNIYWDPNYINPDGKKGRLTFDDENTTANWDYQGVCFVWGSLVAIAPTRPYSRGSSILFSPVSFLETELPAAGRGLNIPTETNRHYILEAHDPDNNIGDICKYITDRGWAPGVNEGKKWRIPTAAELGPATKYSWTWGAGQIQTVDRNGTTRIPTPFVYENLKLPRNGAGFTNNANPWNYDWAGSYMSGTAAGVFRYLLYVYNGGAPTISEQHYNNLMGVRCVLESK